jgi:tetratricopeptide (TPR) repeat protein
LAFKTRSGPKKLAYFLASGVIISAITIIGSAMLSADKSVFTLILLPKLAGWSIAIDSFKTSAIFGTGPGSFLSVFTQFKPLFLNRLDSWALNFGISSNEYLHLMTTLGLAGIATIGLLIAGLFKLAKREPGTRITANQLAVHSALAATALLGLFVPFSPLIWITLAGYLILTTTLAKAKSSPKIKDVILTINAITVVDPDAPTPVAVTDRSNLMPWILAVPISAGLIFLTLLASRAYAAEYIFKKSLDAARENRGGETYNLQIAALQKNPNLDRYRLAYSNTNFALANALAGQKELTDQDKQTISQLIQQAIREAKLATQLNPQRANNWRNLANLYRNLVNFADGADQFAIASYIRAIQLDPANPLLRVELGGLFYGLQRYDEAINNFQQSVQLKPDYANGYYNLSAAYKANNKILEAYQAMQQVVALLEPGSEDAQKAQQELADLKAQLPPPAQTSATEAETKRGGTLSAPEKPPAAPKDLQGAIEVEEPEIPNPSPTPTP